MSTDVITAPQEARDGVRTEQCGATAMDGTPCRDFGDIQVVAAGCVHEHIRTGPLCRVCREKLANGNLDCAACFTSREPHRCHLRPGLSR